MTKQQVMDTAVSTNLKGGHITAHIDYLARDAGKQNEVKVIIQNMAQLQNAANELMALAQQMPDQQQQGAMTDADIELQRKAAMAAIEVDTKQKLADIKAASIVAQHEIRSEIQKEKGATDMAIKLAKANQEAALKKQEPQNQTKSDES
jgi:hypothetical protein